MKIGLIGLGIMGSRMAANLQKHDYFLIVFNRTRDKAEPLLDRGARLGSWYRRTHLSFAHKVRKLSRSRTIITFIGKKLVWGATSARNWEC